MVALTRYPDERAKLWNDFDGVAGTAVEEIVRANRDEDTLDSPRRFDVTRSPNPQLGYGGCGAHFCLGANLARREIRLAYEELHRQIPDVVAVEEPAVLRSAFVHGIKRLPVAWAPPA